MITSSEVTNGKLLADFEQSFKLKPNSAVQKARQRAKLFQGQTTGPIMGNSRRVTQKETKSMYFLHKMSSSAKICQPVKPNAVQVHCTEGVRSNGTALVFFISFTLYGKSHRIFLSMCVQVLFLKNGPQKTSRNCKNISDYLRDEILIPYIQLYECRNAKSVLIQR